MSGNKPWIGYDSPGAELTRIDRKLKAFCEGREAK